MKLKQQPEDFQVEELTDVVPTAEGPFAFYRLEKQGWTTPDALQAVRRRWKVNLRRLSYGGLKDRHAHTVQFLTILGGPRKRLTHHAVCLEYLGQVAAPYTSRDIRANRFQLTLRDLAQSAATAAEQALEEVRAQGVSNYFDDQRFGSAGPAGRFVARAIVEGRHEEALRLALAEPYQHDRAAQKREKAILRGCWGNWAVCKERLPRGHARSLVDYLSHHPDDFRGAIARLRPDLRGLYLSAYQSHLWNRMLARWLTEHCRPEQILAVGLRLGEVPVHRGLDASQLAALAGLRLPLPSARLQLDATDAGVVLMDAVLREEGLEREQLKLKGFREMFFSKGDRAALCVPDKLSHEVQADERHPGKRKLLLAFELPRGCYATLIVKRITT
ncbi:MAG TPA: tRNA pseudouridine(13) synthase TruD [Gemmataceae bacterium]|jgi:tRNA pseudouridine13 synthase|nr:tRNA pseudouridine(13) synthase TruD [Gemmataceae bacterium]